MREYAGYTSGSFWLVSTGVSLLVAAAIAAQFFVSRENSLANNGRWLVTKTTFETSLMGAESFLTGSQALAENRLNLGAWHGFHEVIFKEKLLPGEVAFRFLLEPNAYLVFIFNKDSESFEGIRFSANPAFPCAYLHVRDSGEFVAKRPIIAGALSENNWHECRVVYSKDRVVLRLDGMEQTIACDPWNEAGSWGFRGSFAPAYVDDVSLIARDGVERYEESFSNRVRFGRVFSWVASGAILMELVLLLAAKFIIRTWQLALRNLTAINITVLTAVLALFLGSFYVLAERYPKIEGEKKGAAPRIPAAALMASLDMIAEAYPPGSAPLERRILFVGTSQTYGAGAPRRSLAFVQQLEDMLNNRIASPIPFQCINTGVQSANSCDLIDAYEKQWLNYGHDLAVINLSCNDTAQMTEPEVFAANLRKFVDLNRGRGIKTLFVLETASPEVWPDGYPLFTVMERVARETDVPCVNAHVFMRGHQDDGFLFWDGVHPTAFGHRLLAEFLLPAVMDQLGLT